MKMTLEHERNQEELTQYNTVYNTQKSTPNFDEQTLQ